MKFVAVLMLVKAVFLFHIYVIPDKLHCSYLEIRG